MDKNQIRNIVRQMDYSKSEIEIDLLTDNIKDNIDNQLYDFSLYRKDIFTQQGKKRIVYSYPNLSTEAVMCQYLKKQIDRNFRIRYASRNRIMNVFFNILPVIKDMNDFVIIRADFKSFFDSVLSRHVYDRYIKESLMSRWDKEILEQYIEEFKYCYAGLCLSNGLTEIVCREFDSRIRAHLSKYGMFFYERYVDDILLITNKYISQNQFCNVIRHTIQEVFGDSPVKINMSPGKFSYITRRNLSTSQKFNFLGYEFEIRKVTGKNSICFKYGIAEKKRKKYTGIIERAFIQFKKDGNIELLRQRLKIYSSRVVIARTIGSSSYDWLTKGVVANYNELQFHMDALEPQTKDFLKNLYVKLLNKHGCVMPYFLKQSLTEESIYNLESNMKRNRSIMFEKNIGVSESTLLKWIRKLNPEYCNEDKDYYRMVIDYLALIKVE